jgi:putative oxidoreductase
MDEFNTSLLKAERVAELHSHLAPVFLRLALGTVFLAHVYAKVAIFTLPGTIAFFQTHGLPGWTVYPVLTIELMGGLALLVGLQVRLAAALLFVVMLGALVPHAGNGWMFTNAGGGWEYVAFLLAALATQVLAGPGALRTKAAPRADASIADRS